jgi:hypothetical protein
MSPDLLQLRNYMINMEINQEYENLAKELSVSAKENNFTQFN